MTDKIIVFKDRTNIVQVSLGINVSDDTITSQIRAYDGTFIAEWQVDFDNDGSDGELIFTLDDSAVSGITYQTGRMDIKRVSSGEPYPVGDELIEVEFRDSVTP